MQRFNKFILPLAFSLACALSYLLFSVALMSLAEPIGAVLTLIFGILFELGLPIFIATIAVPVHSFSYAKKTLAGEKYAYLFSLYNALVLAALCLLFVILKEETYIYAVLLFFWSAFWSVLPLLFKKENPTQ